MKAEKAAVRSVMTFPTLWVQSLRGRHMLLRSLAPWGTSGCWECVALFVWRGWVTVQTSSRGRGILLPFYTGRRYLGMAYTLDLASPHNVVLHYHGVSRSSIQGRDLISGLVYTLWHYLCVRRYEDRRQDAMWVATNTLWGLMDMEVNTSRQKSAGKQMEPVT